MKRTRSANHPSPKQRLWTGDTVARDLLDQDDADLSGILLQHARIADITKADEEDDTSRRRRFRISTETRDRHGDVVRSKGLSLKHYKKNPVVLFAHNASAPPIGSSPSVEIGEGLVDADVEFFDRETYDFADTIFRIVDKGGLRATSIGFMPLDFKRLEDEDGNEMHGIDFKKSDLLEFSIVPIPANPEAVARALSDGANMKPYLQWLDDMQDNYGALEALMSELGVGEDDLQSVRKAADGGRIVTMGNLRSETDATRNAMKDLGDAGLQAARKIIDAAVDAQEGGEDRLCWNPQLSKTFDIDRERFEPASAELGLVARYLDCEVKELYQGGTRVVSARMGSFLSALDEGVQQWEVDDVRNLTYGGRESPPVHDVIQLNSTQSRDFLVDGTRFMRGSGARVVLDVEPAWYGLDVTVFSRNDDQEQVRKLLGDTWQRALQLNFLKGEAFSLSGQFLPRTEESWDDIFLSTDNEKAVRRVVDLVNSKGDQLDNRGMMLLGPPGTGKTLSARVARNEAKCTFIWVSARDFYRAGAFGGIGHAFELARECAPSMVVFEDIDNWLSDVAIDLLKTEMDGVARSKGVVTLLTTNFPERMPKALIDRPGRFHDVLHFSLPDQGTRQRMLHKWLPDLTAKDVLRASSATEGYSGAHLYELARFVGIIQEEEEAELSEALSLALEKLADQRELIDSIQLAGSKYEPSPRIRTLVKSVAAARIPVDHSVPSHEGDNSYRQAHPDGTPAQARDADWDGDKQVTDADVEDLLVMSAWRASKPREELNKGDFRLPHHAATGEHAVNFRACSAAIAALNGARGGVDIPEEDRHAAHNHLARHIRDDFGGEPPEGRWLDVQPLATAPDLFVFDHDACTLMTMFGDGLVDVNLLEWDWEGREEEHRVPALCELGEDEAEEVEKQTFHIQSVAGRKSKWPSRDAFLKWAKEHDFRTDKVDTTRNFWRLRQRDPEDFERFRTLCINPNDAGPNSEECRVQAVGGPLKEEAAADPQVTDDLMTMAFHTAAASRLRDMREGSYGRDLGDAAAERLVRFEGFFQVAGGIAVDVGDEEPNDMVGLDGTPTYARIIQDRNFPDNKARELGPDVTREDAETAAKQIVEAQQDGDVMVIIGEAVGHYQDAPLYRDCAAWRWVQERGEAVRIPLGADLCDPVEQLCQLAAAVGKAGRVLSQANESRLRQALDLLAAVLEQLGNQEPPEEEEAQREAGLSDDDDVLQELLREIGVGDAVQQQTAEGEDVGTLMHNAGDEMSSVFTHLVQQNLADAVKGGAQEEISKATGTVD